MNFSAVKLVYNAYTEVLRKKHNLGPLSVPRKKKIQNETTKDLQDTQLQHKSNNNVYKENSFTTTINKNNNNNSRGHSWVMQEKEEDEGGLHVNKGFKMLLWEIPKIFLIDVYVVWELFC